jgi:hypothetical protein
MRSACSLTSARRAGTSAQRLRRVLGREHRDVLNARYGHAKWMGRAGDPVGARDLFAELVSELMQIFGRRDEDTKDAFAAYFRWRIAVMEQAFSRRFTRLLGVASARRRK